MRVATLTFAALAAARYAAFDRAGAWAVLEDRDRFREPDLPVADFRGLGLAPGPVVFDGRPGHARPDTVFRDAKLHLVCLLGVTPR